MTRMGGLAYWPNTLIHVRSAKPKSGASGLPYYCPPPVTVPDVSGTLGHSRASAARRHHTGKKKSWLAYIRAYLGRFYSWDMPRRRHVSRNASASESMFA